MKNLKCHSANVESDNRCYLSHPLTPELFEDKTNLQDSEGCEGVKNMTLYISSSQKIMYLVTLYNTKFS